MIYSKKNEEFTSLFISCTLWLGVITLPVGYFLFAYGLNYDGIMGLSLVVLFVCISQLWLNMEFVCKIKNYTVIIVSYFLGMLLSLLLAWLAGNRWGMAGVFLGFSVGQACLLFWLVYSLLQDFKGVFRLQPLLPILRRYPHLFFMGLFYNLGIWIDKIILWYSQYGENTRGWIYASYLYDAPVFYAYLTIIPGIAFFTLKLETDFFERYRHYYHIILKKASYKKIESARKEIVDNLVNNGRKLLISQVVIVAVCFFFAEEIVLLLRLDTLQVPIFRYAILAAMFHLFFLILLTVLCYFDFLYDVFWLAGLFLVLNLVFTRLSLVPGDIRYLGLGYLAACYLLCMISFIVVQIRLRRLEYYTFSWQNV